MSKISHILIPIGVVAVAVAMLIVYMFPVSCKSCSRTAIEGFQAINQPITMCPDSSTSFYDKKGNLNCCTGQVNGDICQGTVLCTFSSAAEGIPFCNQINRKRKFLGEVNPFVRKFLQQNPRQQYALLLDGLKKIAQSLGQLPETQLSQSDKQKLQALVDEEDTFFTTQSNPQTKLAVYEDEVMYSIQYLENLFRNKPILQNKELLQQQTQKLVCTMQK